jgi:hypothetical protein
MPMGGGGVFSEMANDCSDGYFLGWMRAILPIGYIK